MTAAETSNAAASGDSGSRLVHCTSYGEIALPASRAFIGSLIRPFLDQMVITPTELVFSGRHQTRLESSGTLLNEAIEKAAGMQARALSLPPLPRMRDLQMLVAQLMMATKEIERVEPLQPLKPGQLAPTMESLRASCTPGALAPRVYRVLTELLAGARVWGEKIELAVGLAQEALTCDAGEYLDPLLGEIVQSELAQDVIFGRMISLETRIDGLIALLKGEYEGDQYTTPARSTLELNKLMGQATWPDLRAAIETAIVAHLAGKLALRASDLLGELKALHGLLGRLRDGNRTIGGRRALEFVERRMARLLSPEAITDHLREYASMLERMIALVELYAVTFGPTNRKLVSDFITRYFCDDDFDRRLMAGEGAPQHKLALLTRLYRVVLTSSIQPEDKQIYAKRLARIQTNFLDSSKLFAAIDKQHSNSARKCQHVVSLCVDGCFIPGENLDRAKALIRHYMAKPDFLDKLNEGQTRTESGRIESVGQFKANLKKLNIPAPFDAREYARMEDSAAHLLVVDDDERLRSLLQRYLTGEGYRVTTARDAAEARTKLASVAFDLVVLDRMMPGESGLDFTRDWRRGSTLPILMLTAMGEVDDRISGLESGADDYLAKPFEPKELLLRIRTILKRAGNARPQRQIAFGNCLFDGDRQLLVRSGKNVRLTQAETVLLAAFAARPGVILSREDLAGLGIAQGQGRTIDVQVTRLRRKIEEDPRFPRYLQTVRGKGYVLQPD